MTYLRSLAHSQPSLLTPKWTHYIPHDPTLKQRAFLLLPHLEAFYGGSAGGGKSDALLMAALQYVDVPGYRAIIFRRTYADLALPGALMDRSGEWLGGTDAHWGALDKTWTFPSGATLSFGYLASENDKYRYQGAEFQFVGFDEVTHFPEASYRYLFSRLRRLEGSRVPLRMRAASNPGGVGHEWVKRRFITEGRKHGRPFVPARLGDNPHLDRDEYVQSLMQLDPVTRAQLLKGDWDVREGGDYFKRHWFRLVDAMPESCTRVRWWDMAATAPKPGKDPDWTVGLLAGRDDEGHLYIGDIRRMRGGPGEVEKLIRQTAQLDGPETIQLMGEEGGSAGKKMIYDYTLRVLPGYAFKGIRETGDKVTRAMPVSSQAEIGNVSVVKGPWLTAFFDEIEAFPYGAHDDQVDAMSGALMQLIQGRGSWLIA